MFSYRHSFHAGNHADVLKHSALVVVLRYLAAAKDTPLLLADTHAGTGLYRLDRADAQTSGEALEGVLPLWQQYGPGAEGQASAPEALAAYLHVLAERNASGELRKYPGSPFIAAALMRPQDQLRLFELHPTDSRLLDKNVAGLSNATQIEVVRNNGFTGLKALLPPASRRALVLIDPSYELKTDYAQVVACLQDAMQRFATGCYIVWYPVIPRQEAHQLSPPPQGSGAAGGQKLVACHFVNWQGGAGERTRRFARQRHLRDQSTICVAGAVERGVACHLPYSAARGRARMATGGQPMSAKKSSKKTPVTWRKPDGSVVSCYEKVKVLNENYTEVQALLQDLLDDALVLGCSEAQVRQALQHLLDGLQATVAERTDGA